LTVKSGSTGFPSTQQAEKINARAKQQKAVQEEYKKAEAECVLLAQSSEPVLTICSSL